MPSTIATPHKQRMQNYIVEYEKLNKDKVEYSPKEIARWLMQNNKWEPPPELALQKCAEEVSRALHDMSTVDPSGQRVRTHHVLYSSEGKQLELWADWRKLTRDQMEFSFKGRKKQIVGDCVRLKTEINSYNKFVNPEPTNPIQMDFNLEFELELLIPDEDEEGTAKMVTSTSATEPSKLPRRLPVAARRSATGPEPVRL